MKKNNARKEELSLLKEINVTPFIDVMLVLLIIFMVVAPLAAVNIPLNLPKSDQRATPSDEHAIVVSLNKEMTLFINETPVADADVVSVLEKATHHNKQERIFIRVEKTLPYEHFTDLINKLSSLGYSRIALVNEKAN